MERNFYFKTTHINYFVLDINTNGRIESVVFVDELATYNI